MTTSVASLLPGTAIHDHPASGITVQTPVLDLVAVITAHVPATEDAGAVARRLVEQYALPAAR